MLKNFFIFIISVYGFTLFSCQEKRAPKEMDSNQFITIEGQDLIKPDGTKLSIKGSNLGNWLNPEGYMFEFNKASSARLINELICEMVGPSYASEFWSKYKDNYITAQDINFLKEIGCNTIRLPFHYKLFTNEEYMGKACDQEGFKRIDSLVKWCKDTNLYLILDMHVAPGGQTGDNIDDSYGYPWLFESKADQSLYASIWKKIAKKYKNEPIILGYELLNEPIAHYFENKDELNSKLVDVYQLAIDSIRMVDNNHIIILGGAQWNSNFEPLKKPIHDSKIVYSCHRYGGDASKEAIASFIQFRDSINKPMFMGEIGHNTDEWMSCFVDVMNENNIGWLFWPYKKMGESCFVGIKQPDNWNTITNFEKSNRDTFGSIRENRPNQQEVIKILNNYLDLISFSNNLIQNDYINAIQLKTN